MIRKTICLFVLGVVVAATLVIAGIVSAQNSNSSTTTSNANTATKKPRRHKAKPKAAAAASEAAAPATMETPQPAAPARKATGRCDPTQQEQTDLSGTYTGKLKHGDEPVTDATLTITGTNFTMTSGSETHSGRLAAVTTCGYTAVTFMMGDPMTTGGNPPSAVSLRAKKVGDKLTLTSVPGEPRMISFTTGGTGMKAKPRHRMTKPKTAAPSPPPQ